MTRPSKIFWASLLVWTVDVCMIVGILVYGLYALEQDHREHRKQVVERIRTADADELSHIKHTRTVEEWEQLCREAGRDSHTGERLNP